jgi:hypothetical protein
LGRAPTGEPNPSLAFALFRANCYPSAGIESCCSVTVRSHWGGGGVLWLASPMYLRRHWISIIFFVNCWWLFCYTMYLRRLCYSCFFLDIVIHFSSSICLGFVRWG